LHLPLQFLLVAAQPLETTLPLLGRHIRARQCLLLAAHRLLPLRHLAHAPQRLALFFALLLLGTRRRSALVVRALLTLQLAVEQRRQILIATAPTSAATLILRLH